MNIILSSVKWQFALVYLHDIVKLSKSRDEHINHLQQVLTQLTDGEVTLKLKKCGFFTNPIIYLGDVFKPGCLAVR